MHGSPQRMAAVLALLTGCSEELSWSQSELPIRKACIDLRFYASDADATQVLDLLFVDDPIAQAKRADGFLEATYDLSDPADGLAVTVNGTAQIGEHLVSGCQDFMAEEPVLEKEFQVVEGRVELQVDASDVSAEPDQGGAVISFTLTDGLFRRGKRGTLRLDLLEQDELSVSGPGG
jgi:hypothetical protein